MDYQKELEEMKRRVYNVATGEADVDYTNAKEIAEYIDPDLNVADVMFCRLALAIDALNSYIKDNEKMPDAEKVVALKNNEELRRWIEDKRYTLESFTPRFKVGDWISNGCYSYLIKEIDTYGNVYIAENKYGESCNLVFSYYDKNFHLWTINDARRGDALCHEGKAFIFSGELEEGRWPFAICGLDEDDNLIISKQLVPWVHADVCPATKPQREHLSRIINENGYTWNEKTQTTEKTHGNEGL